MSKAEEKAVGAALLAAGALVFVATVADISEKREQQRYVERGCVQEGQDGTTTIAPGFVIEGTAWICPKSEGV
jgi:hypothetical protein